MIRLKHDPWNVIVCGVGGQGNVWASRILGEMLNLQGFNVGIGEIFGASQRGGSVMSHVRISEKPQLSPRIPLGAAHILLSLEPAETLTVLKDFGNPAITVISNTRPVYPIGVISGELDYPDLDDIKTWVQRLSVRSWFVPASDAAMSLGNPVLANGVLLGALAGTGLLPLPCSILEQVLSTRLNASHIRINLEAYALGVDLLQTERAGT